MKDELKKKAFGFAGEMAAQCMHDSTSDKYYKEACEELSKIYKGFEEFIYENYTEK